jgi:predicted membrane protein
MINSDSFKDYIQKSNTKPLIRMEYFNFNDIVGSFLTLFTLLLGGSWISIYDMFYHIYPKFSTTFFFVFFNISVSFVIYALMVGIIAKFVLLYFNSRLIKKFKKKKKIMQSNDEEIQEANVMDLN